MIIIMSSNESVSIASPEKEAESIKHLTVTRVQPTPPSFDDSFQLIVGLLDLIQEQVQPVTSALLVMSAEWHVANWSDLLVLMRKMLVPTLRPRNHRHSPHPKFPNDWVSSLLTLILGVQLIHLPL